MANSLKQRQAAGRPAKPGPRTASGRRTEKAAAPATWQRIREHGAALGADPRLGGEIGRLSFAQLLTDTQATTAVHIGSWYARGAAALCSPRRSAGGSTLMSQTRNEKLTEQDLEEIAQRADSVDQDDLERRDRSAIRKIQKVQGMLPPKARDLIENACVLDMPVPDEHVGALGVLLSHIAQAFGIEHKTALPALPPALRPRARRVTSATMKVKRREPTVTLALAAKALRAVRPDLGDQAVALLTAFCDRARERKTRKCPAPAPALPTVPSPSIVPCQPSEITGAQPQEAHA